MTSHYAQATTRPDFSTRPRFFYPPWYLLRTRKQRIRCRRLARRAGMNPDWVSAKYSVSFLIGDPNAFVSHIANGANWVMPIIYQHPSN